MFRAQQRMNGMAPKLDANGAPTGAYVQKELKVSDMGAAEATTGTNDSNASANSARVTIWPGLTPQKLTKCPKSMQPTRQKTGSAPNAAGFMPRRA